MLSFPMNSKTSFETLSVFSCSVCDTFSDSCIAFSSVIGNYYYGEANIEFLNGNKVWLNTYRVCVVGMVMFGSLAKIQVVWDMADLFMGIMAVINLIAIGLLGKISIEALKDYRAQKAQGLDPKFRKSSIPGLKNVECWED